MFMARWIKNRPKPRRGEMFIATHPTSDLNPVRGEMFINASAKTRVQTP